MLADQDEYGQHKSALCAALTVAIVSNPPAKAVIDGFKGVLDFYVHMGQQCVRKWPHYTRRTPHPDEAANQSAFKYVNTGTQYTPATVANAYRAQVVGIKYTWRDLYVQAYMGGIRYEVAS